MMNTEYYSHKFVGMSENATELLAEAYLIRQDMNNPKWVDLYAKWLNTTDRKYHVDGQGLKDFRTMAVFYFEKVKVGKNRLIKKDIRLEGYESLKQYAKHEMKKRTDIYYDGI